MASRMFQSVVVRMRESTNRMLGIMDATGTVVACSSLSQVGQYWEPALAALEESEGIVRVQGCTFKTLECSTAHFDYAAFVAGEDELASSLCVMAAVAFNSAKAFYDEKHDKATFVKNIILDNVLPGDIYVRGRELGLEGAQARAVLLIRQLDKAENAVMDVMLGLFPDRQRDFIISLNEREIALVKEVASGVGAEELTKLALAIEETIKSELMVRTVIGIGSVCYQVKDLASTYKEAQVAIEVGKVFDTEKSIITYENLGIGRLIYQLPTTMCEMFLSEVFKKNTIDSLDHETLETILKFFENNLNVSETSRKLFVHRNTLVYRLEKIKKLTGLDLREFDHAIVFKVALMVKRYLDSRAGG